MGQADVEGAESYRHPAVRGWLEAEALWVDQRDDRERCATVGQVHAADTSVVLDQDAEEVLVSDLLGMAG